MSRSMPLALSAIFSLLVTIPGPAFAQGCGDTITADLTLTEDLDLTGCTGTALIIGADNITIDGQGHTILAPNAAVGMLLHGRTGVTIRNLTLSPSLSGIDGTGIAMSRSSNNLVEGCTINGRARGVALTDPQGICSGNRIQHNNLSCNGTAVYGASSGAGNHIFDNDLSRSSQWSIEFSYDSAVVIAENVYAGSANGIHLHLMEGASLELEDLGGIRDNALSLTYVMRSTIVGLTLGGNHAVSVNQSHGNVLFGLRAILGGSGPGIELARSSDNLIEGCVVHGYSFGIALTDPQGTCDRSVLQNNDLSRNGTGVMGQSSGNGTKLLGNDLSGSATYSIQFSYDSALEIAGNDYTGSMNGISLTDMSGMHLSGEDLSTSPGFALALTRVHDSTFTHLPADAANISVYLVNCNDNLIASVTASGTGSGTGIYLAGSSSNNRIEGCKVSGRANGVYLQEAAGGTVIHGNDLSENVNGVQGRSTGQGNKILGNDLAGSASYAITFNNDNALEISGNSYVGSANGIGLASLNGIHLTGEDLRSLQGYALSLASVSHSTFSNLFAAGSGAGVYAVASDLNLFSNIDASGASVLPGGSGFALIDCANNSLEGVTAKYRAIGIDVHGADNSVRCSTVTQNATGIRVGTSSPGNHVRNCQITGNLLGINAGSLLDAEDNYWGAANGPAPLGTGDSFAGDVDAEPFFASLTTVFAGCPGMRNESPVVACSGGGTYQAGTDAVTLEGTVSDLEGDSISYAWHEGELVLDSGIVTAILGGEPVSVTALHFTTGVNHLPEIGLLGVGAHTLTLTTSDGHNPPVDCLVEVVVLDTLAPSLAPVSNVGILWPPNHELVDIVIDANALDLSGGAVSLTATVTSSQPADGTGDGSTEPDFTEPLIDPATGTLTLQLRAERAGNGPARTYTITLTATDASGNVSTAIVTVQAPRNQARGR